MIGGETTKKYLVLCVSLSLQLRCATDVPGLEELRETLIRNCCFVYIQQHTEQTEMIALIALKNVSEQKMLTHKILKLLLLHTILFLFPLELRDN